MITMCYDEDKKTSNDYSNYDVYWATGGYEAELGVTTSVLRYWILCDVCVGVGGGGWKGRECQ